MVYWMTGLSGSGKTTIAQGVAERHAVEVLDGDRLRRGPCAGLGFSPEDRRENLRRAAHMAAALSPHVDVIVACITPYESARDMVRRICPDVRLVYVKASVEECRRRDPKGLYARADRGEISGLTGVDDPFDPPAAADLVLDTERHTPAECVDALLRFISGQGG
jgi:adenylyl-sulfate kinase